MNINGSQMKVAISSDFLISFSAIPKKQQTKVRDFIEKFKRDPAASGINYEKINGARDNNLRSVRIDVSYRAIILKPETGNVYLLLWVDNHDEAYQWAQKRLCKVHPDTGSLQVVVASENMAVEAAIPEKEKPGLFDKFRDRELIRLGVPEMLLPSVRLLQTEDDLDNAEKEFPEEVSEALYLLAMGYSLEEAYSELEKKPEPEPVNVDDFSTALENADSKRRFYVVENDLEFEAILNAPLEKWRVFLHPTQRAFVSKTFNGPVRLLGGAGTGKTVVGMHRAKWLAETICREPHEKVLFTTYTKNLTADISENLSKICSEETFRKIEVVNLDKWVADFLKKHGYNFEVDFLGQATDIWEKAMYRRPASLNLKRGFYREEWEKIVQPQEIMDLAAYMKAPRIGRGTRVGRKERKEIWPVFEEYRILLNEENIKETVDAMLDARLILEGEKETLPYRAIVVDEAQDMSTQAFRLLRELMPEKENDIFIVGDAHQRIYKHRVVLSQCGINIRGRSRRLRVNYRTTEEIRSWATGILEGCNIDDLDGGTDQQKGYKSLIHGEKPVIKQFESFKEEIDHIVEILNAEGKDPENLKNICLVARTNNLLDEYAQQLKNLGIETYMIKRTKAEDRKTPGLRLATMHRVKGLEFDKVIVAGVNDEWVPLQIELNEASDESAKKDIEQQERSLLYVATTRAKKKVWVTGYGDESGFVK